MANDPWEGDIPGRFQPGQKVKGKITKLTNFGVFVELEPGLEGLLHISELSEAKIESPEDVVKVGDDVDVKVLRVDTKDRKIGLSMKNVDDGLVPDDAQIADFDDTGAPTTTTAGDRDRSGGGTKGLRGGTGSGGLLIQMPGQE
jgi:small subunit ribosomal protein S1